MLASRRPAALVAAGVVVLVSGLACLASVVGCGGEDAQDVEADLDGGGPFDGSGRPDGGALSPPKTCTSDGECGGAKCLPVGSGTKACVTSKSCTGGSGANSKCGGIDGDESAEGASDCCQTAMVSGGSFNRFNDPAYPATVSPFLLDVFEVTGGRFRAWVEATNGNLRAAAPQVGAGAHPKVAGSGWRAEWNAVLPTSRAEVDAMFGPGKCEVGTNLDDYGTLTWWTANIESQIKAKNPGNSAVLAANTKTALDSKGLNCVPWHVLMAFCVWDGGRLPTDAEWSFAAQGGSEQRPFPWGTVDAKDLVNIDGRSDMSRVPVLEAGSPFLVASLYDPTLGANKFPANYVHSWGGSFRTPSDNALHVAPVGRRVKGNGKWGHADLSGGMYEWTMDEGPITKGPCSDCAKVDYPSLDGFDPNAQSSTIPDFPHALYAGGARSVRGGAWDNSLGIANGQSQLEIEVYTAYPVKRTYRSLGGRCARNM